MALQHPFGALLRRTAWSEPCPAQQVIPSTSGSFDTDASAGKLE
jgi:hypothetical protein